MTKKTNFKVPGHSPVGTFQWPKLVEPDTKFDPVGVFSVNLIVDAEGLAEMEQQVKPALDVMQEMIDEQPAAKRKRIVVNEWFTEQLDDDDNETGMYVVKFKTKAVIQGEPRVVAMYDPTGTRLNNINPWGGTIGKVAYAAFPYVIPGTKMAGISLRLNAVQILELVTGGKASAATSERNSYGFGAVAGYDAIEDGEEEEVVNETVAKGGDESDDDLDDTPDF